MTTTFVVFAVVLIVLLIAGTCTGLYFVLKAKVSSSSASVSTSANTSTTTSTTTSATPVISTIGAQVYTTAVTLMSVNSLENQQAFGKVFLADPAVIAMSRSTPGNLSSEQMRSYRDTQIQVIYGSTYGPTISAAYSRYSTGR